MKPEKTIRVLFVCTGNICRSPMAEAVFTHLLEEADLEEHFEIGSAGTGSWHIGEPPHSGTRAILRSHNISFRQDKRARRVKSDDFTSYDYVIAMDRENLQDLAAYGQEVPLLLEFADPDAVAGMKTLDVVDPYYNDGFEYTYNQVLVGCRGLLKHIREREGI